jgi:beta-N-acetylhexosaminidase
MSLDAWSVEFMQIRFPSSEPKPRRRFIRIGRTVALVALLIVAGCGVAQHAGIVERALGGDANVTAPGSVPKITYPAPWSQKSTKQLGALADKYMATMSLDQKLGQLFLANFVGSDYPPSDASMIERNLAGGTVMYARSLLTRDQTLAMVGQAQSHAHIPLFMSIDQEGGGVDRLKDIYGPHPSARTMALSKSTDYTQQQGALTGNQMKALGLNLNFAPDVDVQLVDGRDLGSRNFGTDPQTVTTYASAFLTGLQSAGVVGCLKHFPGLGAAVDDAHLTTPVINRTRAQIEQVELAPYRALIATGQVQCVMTTNLLMPALDPDMPAELSPKIIDGILRHDLGYDGVVVTDALYMADLMQRYGVPETGVLAILAGCDVLEGPSNSASLGGIITALKSALASGRLTQARIDLSVRRVLVLKMRMGLIPTTSK